MAQGAIKKSAKPAFASKRKSQKAKNGGARVAKPQKTKSSSADRVVKKFSSGLISQTEAMLGQRAGHLELIGKGKKAKKKDAAPKGGSRKFG